MALRCGRQPPPLPPVLIPHDRYAPAHPRGSGTAGWAAVDCGVVSADSGRRRFDGSGFLVVDDTSPAFDSDPDNLGTAISFLETALLPDSQEDERERIIGFCADHADALHRSCLEGHLTASAFVVDPTTDAVALIHHRKLDLWLQPGGHADGEGNLALVARTEVDEEIGLTGLRWLFPAFDVNVHPIPARPSEPEHLHLDLRFLALMGGGSPSGGLTANIHETRGAGWIGRADPRFRAVEDVRVAAERALDLAAAFA